MATRVYLPNTSGARPRAAQRMTFAAMAADRRLLALVFAIPAVAAVAISHALLALSLAADVISPATYQFLLVARTIGLIVLSTVLMRYSLDLWAKAEARAESIVDGDRAAAALVDTDGVVVFANAAFRQMVSPHLPARMNVPVETVLAPFLLPTPGRSLLPMDGEASIDILVKSPRGVVRSSAVLVRRLRSAGYAGGWLVRGASAENSGDLAAELRIKTHALDTATDGIAIADLDAPDLPVTYANRACSEITGYSGEEIVGRNLRFLQGSDRLQPEISLLRDGILKRQPVIVTLRNYRRDGTMFWNEIRLSPYAAAGGPATHYICIMRDVTEAKQLNRSLEMLANFDPVTNLYTRARFTSSLAGLLRHTRQPTLLLSIDVMRLKDFAGTFGEAAAHQLLSALADRLDRLKNVTLAGRLSDDTFAVAIELAEETAAPQAVSMALAELQRPFNLECGELEVQFHVGSAVGAPGTDETQLMARTMIALDTARQCSSGTTSAFNLAALDAMRRRSQLASDLRQAIASGDFTLHLQPLVALVDRSWAGAEALLRWCHPVFGLQKPQVFLDLSKRTGQNCEIENWAIRMAAELGASLGAASTGKLVLSVNISPARLFRSDFVRTIADAVQRAGTDPRWMQLEIAEAGLASEPGLARAVLSELRKEGFGIVIDEFGAGLSALSMLDALPVTGVKIDSGIVQGCEHSLYRQKVIQAVVSLGNQVGVEVIANGVENAAQADLLRQSGVAKGLGFCLGGPMEAELFLARVRPRSLASAPLHLR